MENKSFKVGDILCAMWHCTMHYPHFYVVLETTEKTVVLQELSKRMIGHDGYGQQGYEVPVTDRPELNSAKFRKRISHDPLGIPYVEISARSYSMYPARLWDGNPVWADHMD